MAVHPDPGLLGDAGFRLADAVTLGDADLRLDDVDPGNLFGHRMLDLDARIDLDEIELAGIGVHQELDGTGMGVIGGVSQF